MYFRVLSFLSLLPMGMLVAQPNFQDKSLQVCLQGTTGPNHGINVIDYDGDGNEDFFVGR